MRITNPKAQYILQKKHLEARSKKNNSLYSDKHPTEDKVDIKSKRVEHYAISKNSPEDPTVSTKVLDSLSTGMIDFSQEQRDVLATIMSEKANKLKSKS